MIRKIIFGVCFAVTFPFCINAQAADNQQLFAIKGVGTADCARFIESSKNRDREFLLFVGHITGYITAYNQFTSGVYDVAAWEKSMTFLTHLSRFCRQFPEQSFQIAVNEMVRFLSAAAITTRSDVVEFTRDDKKVHLYVATVERMREKLTELNILSDPNSAISSAVIEKYQREKGLEPTGLPDQNTLANLFYSASTP